MSAPHVVAVACLADSSLTLLAEWQQVFTDYVSPLLQRLTELNPTSQFRIGFVCYATSCTRPSPLLSKSFFTHPHNIFKDLREEPTKYGIGQTGNGGSRGMAVLEGIVAAVELFDILKESLQDAACHIIHITACAPDTADRPLWNSSPRLDSTSWDNLPAELRKREISYSSFLLQRNPRLLQFQAAVAAGSTQSAWFPVRPPHTAHISGFSTQKGTKRVGEPPSTTDRSPDTKRPRVLSQTSPKATPKIQPAIPPTPNPANTTPAPASHAPPSTSSSGPPTASSSAPQPPAAAAPPPAVPVIAGQPQLQALMDRYRTGEHIFKQKMRTMEAHVKAGRTEEATAMKAEITDMVSKLQRIKAILQGQMQALGVQQPPTQGQQQPAAAAASSVPQQPPSSQPVQTTPATQPALSPEKPQQPQPSPQPPKAAKLPQQPQGQIVAKPPAPAPPSSAVPQTSPNQLQTVPNSLAPVQLPIVPPSQPTLPVQPLAPPPLPPPPPAQVAQTHGMSMPPNAAAQMAAQMQKLVEVRNRTPHMASATVAAVPQPLVNAAVDHVQHNGVNAAAGPSQVTGTGVVWQGVLTWKGSDSETQARKELQWQVIAQIPLNFVELAQLNTWPNVLTLTPSRELALPLPVLQDWLKRHKTIIFPLFSNPRIPDSKTNEDNFKVLGRLLAEKNIYALAAWGQEKVENRMLLFWLNNRIVAVYFPLVGGMPELPRNVIGGVNLLQVPVGLAILLSKMSPEIQNQMGQLPPEQRLVWLQGMVSRHAQVRSQQVGQGQGMMAGQGAGDGGMGGQVANAAGMHQRTGSGSGLGNVSLDVLQSFMQRKPDGPNV